MNSMKNYIFTFWEPKEKMPAYVKLCVQTWHLFLQNYQIVVLDYSNLNDWLDKKTIDQILSKDMSLAIQADAIRIALLEKHGGIWMDADTIITSSTFLEFCKKTPLIMIGDPQNLSPHMAFIKASQKSKLLKRWLKHINARVKFFKSLNRYKYFYFLIKKKWKKAHAWDFLGNGIINKLLQKASTKEYKILDRQTFGVMPEILLNKDKTLLQKQIYQKFYFQDNIKPQEILKTTKGIIMLHNSWTPEMYKQLNEEDFFSTDNTLSNLLTFLLQGSKHA